MERRNVQERRDTKLVPPPCSIEPRSPVTPETSCFLCSEPSSAAMTAMSIDKLIHGLIASIPKQPQEASLTAIW